MDPRIAPFKPKFKAPFDPLFLAPAPSPAPETPVAEPPISVKEAVPGSPGIAEMVASLMGKDVVVAANRTDQPGKYMLRRTGAGGYFRRRDGEHITGNSCCLKNASMIAAADNETYAPEADLGCSRVFAGQFSGGPGDGADWKKAEWDAEYGAFRDADGNPLDNVSYIRFGDDRKTVEYIL